MRKFILNIIQFSLLFSLVVAVSFFLLKKLVQETADFKIQKDTKYIVIGHSHPECAYNDSLISNFENFSISGESYFYTLPKVKNIVAQNPQLETVFLEFTNNQISKNVEDWIWEDKYLSYYYAIYSPFIETKDRFLIVKKRPIAFLKNLPIVFKDLLKKTIKPIKYSYEFGGYKKIEGTLEKYENKKEDKVIEDFVLIDNQVSSIHIFYLKKIIDFLNQNNVEVVLIRSPQHHTYQGFENEAKYQEILNKEFSDVFYIDFNKLPLLDHHFRDPEHLNSEGAKIITNHLNKMLLTDFTASLDSKKHVDYFELIQID